MKIQIKKLSEDAIIPTRGSEGAAGWDLRSAEDYVLRPGERHLFKTNISIKMVRGHYGKIEGRSGLAFKKGIVVLGGVIDEDFVGNIGVILLNSSYQDDDDYYKNEYSDEFLEIKKGDRIAQIIFHKYESAEFEEVDKLDLTERGAGGFGSTGK